jgi:hypothetical protein
MATQTIDQIKLLFLGLIAALALPVLVQATDALVAANAHGPLSMQMAAP